MTERMELLYAYTREHRVAGYLGRRACEEVGRLEEKNPAALRRELSGEQRAAQARVYISSRGLPRHVGSSVIPSR